MRLGCPNCGTRYELPDAAVPAAGREVQCSSCDYRWFFRPDGTETPADEALARGQAVPGGGEPRAAAGPPPEEPPRPRGTDPAVLQILREEAAREMAERRRAGAQAQAGGPVPAAAEAPPQDPHPRRALLPDIDEVSPTLHPDKAARPAGAARRVEHAAPARGGFATGFAVALLLALLAAAAYVWSGELAEAVPALAEPLERFVAAVDALRDAIRRRVE